MTIHNPHATRSSAPGLRTTAVRFLSESRRGAKPDLSGVREISSRAKERATEAAPRSFAVDGLVFVWSGTVMLPNLSVPAYRVVRGECARCGGKFLSEAEVPVGASYPESETLLAIGRAVTGNAVCPSPGCKACASFNGKQNPS